MANGKNKDTSKIAGKSYLGKDFSSFKADLHRFAKNYFSANIQDFSEASLGGMFLELAAYVGDSMTYYLDHQYNELNPGTAIETRNIVMHAKNAGVKMYGAAPSTVLVTWYIKVPAIQDSKGNFIPDKTALPVLKEGGITISAANGTKFTLAEDLDFSETNFYGVYKATYSVSQNNSDGTPATYIMKREVLCISGGIASESFDISNSPKPFRKLTLSKQDVSEVIYVRDSAGNNYYQVESLTQDVVFQGIKNQDKDGDMVTSNLEIIPAPYRYTGTTDFRTRKYVIQFGSGDADSLDDDIIPDPSELALPLYGKKQFTKFSIDPNSMLRTKTLGIAPKNTVITIQYRSGGGISHNVPATSIRTIDSMSIKFPWGATTEVANSVIASLDVKNMAPAGGGASAPRIDDLRAQISTARNHQQRMVTQQDLLARIHTLPSRFGRVYRAGISQSKENPLASELYVLCQDANKKLTLAPDALKKNLRVYLNEFRLISDAIDILDGTVINYGIYFSIIVTPSSNKSTVITSVTTNIKKVSDIKFFQIDQPIVEADIINAIINTDGVLSMVDLQFNSIIGTQQDREYSDFDFDMNKNMFKGLFVGTKGSIFELRYPDDDIIGTAE